MRRSTILGTTFLVACGIGLLPRTSRAANSIWAGRPGKLLPTDQTAWCSYSTSTVNGLYTVTGNLMEVNTDGSIVTSTYTDSATTLAVGIQCWNATTGMSAPKLGTFASKNATVQCPAGDNFGYFLRCMIKSTDSAPIIYDGSDVGGSPCGNGVSSITQPAGSNGFKGQITGQLAVMNYSPPSNTLYNNSTSNPLMANAQVYGTDLGYMFYASGKLWAGYGDTWANWMEVPASPTNKRGSVLFSTTDLNPSDGLTYSSYVGAPNTYPGAPGYATEIVPSCHNTSPCNEITAIADAGFGLQEGGTSYHILWFTSFNSWGNVFTGAPPSINDSSLAWSSAPANGTFSAFSRVDQGVDAIPGVTPPKWTGTSSFGAGAVWQDRVNGFIYFFGTKPYQTGTPVRLARVPAKFASVMNQNSYQYWNGSTWLTSESGLTSPAADVIPAATSAGPELSVAFDAYANRLLMMVVANRESSATEAVQLWEASLPTGPWTQVATGNSLPNAAAPAQWPGDLYGGGYSYFYGPYMNEEIMQNGGQNVYYQMSEWNGQPTCPLYPLCSPYPAGLPYNVGLWNYNVNRSLVSSCTP